jgi:hypothetical protein
MDYVPKHRSYQLKNKQRLNRMQTTKISMLGLLIQKESETWGEPEADTKISFKASEHRNGHAAEEEENHSHR